MLPVSAWLFADSDKSKETLDSLQVKVSAPFVELHSGPGRGYPVLHVIAQDDVVEIIRRRNEWYKVKFHTKRKVYKGWVKTSQMLQAKTLSGEYLQPAAAQRDDYYERNIELGFAYGDIDGTSLLSVNIAWFLSDYFALETALEQAPGVSSDYIVGLIAISHSPFPTAYVSPFFYIGTGFVYTDYKTSLIEGGDDSIDEVASAGFGLRFYLRQNFIARAEYRNSVVLTSNNDNKDPEIWKIGLSIFF